MRLKRDSKIFKWCYFIIPSWEIRRVRQVNPIALLFRGLIVTPLVLLLFGVPILLSCFWDLLNEKFAVEIDD